MVHLFALSFSGAAEAAESTRLHDDEWQVTSAGPLAIDGGLVMGPPMTLPGGMASGVGVGAAYGRRLALGVRAGWSAATESSLVWTVRHDDYRLRATAAVQHAAGRGVLALRLGLGGTLVHEDRTRNQGARAGLTGAELSNSALTLLPAGEVEAVVSVHVAGRWFLALGGGPTALLQDGVFRAAWTAQLGVGWQP
jgi:hypothetical protein